MEIGESLEITPTVPLKLEITPTVPLKLEITPTVPLKLEIKSVQDDALVIVELSRKALVRGGVDGLQGSALYGRVAGWIKVVRSQI